MHVHNALLVASVLAPAVVLAQIPAGAGAVLTYPPCSSVNQMLSSCLRVAPKTDLGHLVGYYSTCLCSEPARYDNPASSCASFIFSLQGEHIDGKIAEYCAGGGTAFPTLPGVGGGLGAAGGASMTATTSHSMSTSTASTAVSASPGSAVTSSGTAASQSGAASVAGLSQTSSATASSGIQSAGATASSSSSAAARRAVQASEGIFTSLMAQLLSLLTAMALI